MLDSHLKKHIPGIECFEKLIFHMQQGETGYSDSPGQQHHRQVDMRPISWEAVPLDEGTLNAPY